MSSINLFLTAFDNYINVTLKNYMSFTETYNISLDENIITLKAIINPTQYNKNIESSLIYKINNGFAATLKNNLTNSILKAFQNSTGLHIYTYTENKIIKIIIKYNLYFDVLPYEIIVNIFLYMDTNSILNMVGFIDKDINIILEDIVKNTDKLYKWILPLDKYDPFDICNYTNYKYTLTSIYEYLINDDIKFNSKLNNKKILDFLLDTSSNIIGKNRFYYADNTENFLIDIEYVTLIKMRQFYPHFNNVRYIKKFSMNLYDLIYQLDLNDNSDNDNNCNLILNYIKTGKIDKAFDIDLTEFNGYEDSGYNLSIHPYFVNNLLYEPEMKYKDFSTYVEVLEFLYNENKKFIYEYKNYISNENLDNLKKYLPIEHPIILILTE